MDFIEDALKYKDELLNIVGKGTLDKATMSSTGWMILRGRQLIEAEFILQRLDTGINKGLRVMMAETLDKLADGERITDSLARTVYGIQRMAAGSLIRRYARCVFNETSKNPSEWADMIFFI